MERSKLAYAISDVMGPIRPEATVLLGIHWQRGVVSGEGPFASVFGPVVSAGGHLDRVRQLFQAGRAAGAHVAHASVCNPPDVVVNNALFSHAKESGALPCGSADTEIVVEVGPQPEDLYLEHHRGSVFFDTDLAPWMAERGLDTVIFTGVATNVAVESTVRDAVDRGYFTIVLDDCCAAGSEERHQAALRNMEVLATRVMPSSELLAALAP